MSAGLQGAVVASRAQIVETVLQRATLPHERTLAVDIVVEQLLDRIAEVLRGEGASRLAVWLDDAYARHAELRVLGALLSTTWRSVAELGGMRSSVADDAAIAAIGELVESVVRRPHAAPQRADAEPLDEIDACIGDLIGRLFEHDPITAEHSRAVSSWCARLARKLGFSHEDMLLVKRGGLAHDIGKIGTPDEILSAARGLTPDEWEIMRRHTTDGAAIVADIPMLADFLPAIRSHHERLDGKGYPDGLRGDQIPVSARVVAVADCFNAMIGRRPYRPPLAPYKALELLRKSAGTHLDPDVVAAMVAVVTAQ